MHFFSPNSQIPLALVSINGFVKKFHPKADFMAGSDTFGRLAMHAKLIFQRGVDDVRPRNSSGTTEFEDSLSDDISAGTDAYDDGFRY